MAIHFIHIGKSGGSALKYAIRQAGKAALEGTDARFNKDAPWESPLGTVHLQGHAFRLSAVPEGDLAFFSGRDPASRFVSSFYSRLRKGLPRHFTEWSEGEAKAFEWFETPQDLAAALAKRRGKKRAQAEFAMTTIRHIRRPMTSWVGEVDHLREKLPQIAYIARQETLDDDWENIKTLLALPGDTALPSDPVQAHRNTGEIDRTLTPKMLDALREWYAGDYRLLELCDEVRPGLIERVKNMASDPDRRGGPAPSPAPRP